MVSHAERLLEAAIFESPARVIGFLFFNRKEWAGA